MNLLKRSIKTMGVGIYCKYGILNLSNLSKISHENEILS